MKGKRLVSFVTTSALLFTMVAPAVAATVDESFGRLNALNVIKGYPDGTNGAEKTITRAEFAAVAVRLLGMDAAVNSAKGVTKFKDVAASHWASGYINLAVGNGVIKGYPNGLFKPEAPVSYAEVSAMLVRVLGYEPQVTGNWPTNYIGKAAQLGVLDGVNTTDFGAAAVRGNVFIASDNCLDTVLLKLTKDGYEEDTQTLMEKRLNVTKYQEATVTDVPAVGNLAKDEVQITYKNDKDETVNKTLKVGPYVDANAVLGLKVEAWEKDDKVFFFDVKTSASDIIDDEIDSVSTTFDTTTARTIHLDAKDKNYTLDLTNVTATGTKLFRNYEQAASGAAKDVKQNDKIRLILDGGKVKYAIINSYKTALVDKVNTTDEKITLEKPSGSVDLADKSVTIRRDGKAATLADIKAGDVVDYLSNDDFAVVYATSASVTGVLKAASNSGSSVTIDAAKFDTISGEGADGAFVSTDNGDSWDATIYDGADYDTLFGENVKGLKNKDGKIAFVMSTGESEGTYTTVLVKKIKYLNDSEVKQVYVAKFDGTEVVYTVDGDTTIDGTEITNEKGTNDWLSKGVGGTSKDIYPGMVVKVKLNADGKLVDNFRVYADADNINEIPAYQTTNRINGIVNKYASTVKADNKLTTVGAADDTAYKVDANTKIIRVKDYQDVSGNVTTDTVFGGTAVAIDSIATVSWDSLKAKDTGLAAGIDANFSIIADGGTAKYIVIFNKNTVASSDNKFDVVKGTGQNGDGAYITLMGDTSKDVVNSDGTVPAKGSLLIYTLNSDQEIDDLAYVAAQEDANHYAYMYVYEASEANDRIKVVFQATPGEVPADDTNAVWIDVNKDTKFFDAADVIADKSGAAVSSIQITDLTEGDVIQAFDTVDSDGDSIAFSGEAGNASFNGGEDIFDFIIRVNK